jgi:hypothetical protein
MIKALIFWIILLLLKQAISQNQKKIKWDKRVGEKH